MKNVLIIDDDVDFTDSVSTLLRLAGHQVACAQEADQGVAMAGAQKPDVVLCDVMMKERTDGFFAVQRLRRTPGLEHTRIVVISSVYEVLPQFQIEPTRNWLGHDVFLQKPIDAAALLRVVEAET